MICLEILLTLVVTIAAVVLAMWVVDLIRMIVVTYMHTHIIVIRHHEDKILLDVNATHDGLQKGSKSLVAIFTCLSLISAERCCEKIFPWKCYKYNMRNKMSDVCL